MRSVMLIDDEYWTLQGLEKLFDWERHGYAVTGAFEDAISALEAMTENAPDLVLTDIRMPEMNGLEMIRRAREAGVCSVFVVISGYSDFEYARGALKYGALDYLLKPVSYQEAEALLVRMDAHFDERASALPGPEPETSNEQFNALLQYMREHYAQRLQLKELAKAFFLNPTYCSELFNKKLGISFSRYLNQLRIDRCCTLLRTTVQSAEEIAAQVGFVDGTHFHKVFKSITGETPGQYRKKRKRE